MANYKKYAEIKNTVIGGDAYAALVSVSPADAADLKAQVAEAAAIDEAGVEICIGRIDIAEVAEAVNACADVLKDKVVVLNLDTTGTDSAASNDQKMNAVKDTAAVVDIYEVNVDANEALLAAVKATGKKLMLAERYFDGVKKTEDIIAEAKGAEAKGADLIYLSYMCIDDPDVITLGYASKEIAASPVVSVPTSVFPMGEVGFQTRILSKQAGNDFGFYQLQEQEGSLFETYDQYKRMYKLYGASYEKIQSEIQYDIDGHVMGGKRFQRCMMIKKRTKNDVIAVAKDVARYNPDLVEWRIDYLVPMGTTQFVANYWIDVLKEIKEIMPKVPILMTFRVKKEGGLKWYPDEQRLFLTKALLNTGLIAYTDTEIDNTPEFIKEMQDACAANGTKLVVSQHKWTYTPSHQEIVDTYKECLDKGAALPKFYMTAVCYEDSVRCSEAMYDVRTSFLKEPCIITAMGDTGLITRTLGGSIGADFEFIDTTGIRGNEEEDIHYVDQLADIFGYEK